MNVSISRNGIEIGEWREDQVRSLYKDGQLLPTDYYWKEGMTEWAELRRMIKPPPPSAASNESATDTPVDTLSKETVAFLKGAADASKEAVIYESPERIKARKNVEKKPKTALGIFVSLFGMIVISDILKSIPILGVAADGGIIGFAIGLIPYFIARSHDNTKNYNHYLVIATAIGMVAGIVAFPILDTSSYHQTLIEQSDSINKTLPTTSDIGQVNSTSVISDSSYHQTLVEEGVSINKTLSKDFEIAENGEISTSVSSNNSIDINITINTKLGALTKLFLIALAKKDLVDIYTSHPKYKERGVSLEVDFYDIYDSEGIPITKITEGPNGITEGPNGITEGPNGITEGPNGLQ
jgi:hypothetical protein